MRRLLHRHEWHPADLGPDATISDLRYACANCPATVWADSRRFGRIAFRLLKQVRPLDPGPARRDGRAPQADRESSR